MTRNDSTSDWNRIAAYLLGDLSSDERLAMEHALHADPVLAALVTETTMGLHALDGEANGTSPTALRRSALRAQLIERVRTMPQAIERPKEVKLGRRDLPHGWYRSSSLRWASAAALAILGAVVGLRSMSDHSSLPQQRQYATRATQLEYITLADGSRITLAPSSRLVIQEDGPARTVTLTGQAYFDLVPSRERAFVVHTGPVQTVVLGTQFDVTRYTGDTTTRVAVRDGRVMTRGRSASVVLDAGTVGYVHDSTGTATVTRNNDVDVDWASGTLVFDNTPVPVMLATLGHWYGYDFHVTDSALATRRAVATFNADQPDKMLRMLKSLLDVTMTFDGTTVTLRPRSIVRPDRARPDRPSRNLTQLEAGK
jgi:transmembrane sensor